MGASGYTNLFTFESRGIVPVESERLHVQQTK
jgi:hypothetical protein